MKRIIFLSLVLCGLLLCGCGSSTMADVENMELSTEVKAAPTIFTDKMHGVSFILPAGWKAANFNDSGDSVIITANLDDAPMMMYTGRDLWGEEYSDTQASVSRSFFSNDLLTEESLADSIGIDISKIKTVEINNLTYFQCEVDDFDGDGQPAVVWCRMDYGCFDMFTFCATSENACYGQFVDLISSVVYDREFPDVDVEDSLDEAETGDAYLAAEWSDDTFKRNGCTSYPLILDAPLKGCKAFTVDYNVSDVTDGKMKKDAKFQIFYRSSEGDWIKGSEFYLDDEGFASIEQTVTKGTTVTEVTVHCLNSGNFSWEASMGIKDPVY